jgi:hypothetical protein
MDYAKWLNPTFFISNLHLKFSGKEGEVVSLRSGRLQVVEAKTAALAPWWGNAESCPDEQCGRMVNPGPPRYRAV